MSPNLIKQLVPTIMLSIGLLACGGGGGGTPPVEPPPANNAPTISVFSGEASATNPLEVTLSWTVTDVDGDTLTCEVDGGKGLDSVSVSDCSTNNSMLVTYPNLGDYNATIAVSDPSGASVSQELAVTVDSLPEPSVVAGDDQLVIFYNRKDKNFDGWILHLWNNDSCDSYADYPSGGGTDWVTGKAQTGVDPFYGAYWLLDLKVDHADCSNFIVHKGNDKDISNNDLAADLTGERMLWTLSGINELYYTPTLFPTGAIIADSAAHWVDTDTLLWTIDSDKVDRVRVYSSATTDMGYDPDNGIGGDNFIEFSISTGTHPSETLNLPRYQGLSAFVSTDVTAKKAKQMLTGKLLAIAYAADDEVLAATYVQTPRVLDALYTSAADDANEAVLGLTYAQDTILSQVWAPTAQSVVLITYDASKTELTRNDMSVNSSTGIWSFDVPISMDRQFYRFELTLYHQQNQAIETIWATDPYSVSLSTNGMYSQFVNLDDADLAPAGWDGHLVPTISEMEDAVIYEGHIRDFSIRDESTSAENRGNYLAFTELSSVPMTHLQTMVDAGLTHFQMLPANDIASIEEDESTRINLNNTVGELCSANAGAPVCGVEDAASTLLSVFQSYDSNTADAQALTESMRNLDSFNWGYDPKHYTTPDGSYSSNPDGVARILEMRSMIKSLHDIGLRVSLDVVYNHTNSSGLWDNSVLDKVVPGYYHRRNLISGDVENATCCQDTAPEHVMMDKLMTDSLVIWARDYKFDAFRFDIMSNNSVDSILNARSAVQAIDPDNYFYGEGWTRDDRGYQQAEQNNMAGTQVGTFNDRYRDIIRSASLFKPTGTLNDQDIIRLGLAGTLKDYQLQDSNGTIKAGSTFSKASYASDPADIINYISKHDNETLWDKLQYDLPADFSIDTRVRAQNVAVSIPLLSQGIPFFQIGGDLLRSKSMDRNTYDAGDWFNFIDFTKNTNNWNVGLPLAQDNQGAWSAIEPIIANNETAAMASHIDFASSIFNEFLAIRSSSKLFRLNNQDDVVARVGFHNTGKNQAQGLIVMSIDDGIGLADLDPQNDAIVVVINGSATEQTHSILTASGFELHSIQQASVDASVQNATFVAGANDGTFTVPAYTTAVFVKPQNGAQGDGLDANVTRDQPDIAPYGNTKIYLRGTMNDWASAGFNSEIALNYDGLGVYSLEVQLTAGEHIFDIVSEDRTTVNLGFADVSIGAGSLSASANGDGDLVITADSDGNYAFTLDASAATPVLTVVAKSTGLDCSALPDSADTIPFRIAGGGQLYVRGDHSGWNAEEAYRMHYKGENRYQAVANFDGSMQFKLASDDGSWTTQLWAQTVGGTSINTSDLEVGVSYSVAYQNAGTDNNSTTLPAGEYSFMLTLNEANPAEGADVGSLVIQACQ